MSDTTSNPIGSDFTLAATHSEMAPQDTNTHLVQLETCIKSVEHLSLDERLAMLDRIKHEVKVAEQNAVREDFEEQIQALFEHMATVCTKVQASGTDIDMPNIKTLLREATDKHKSSCPGSTKISATAGLSFIQEPDSLPTRRG